MRYNIISGKLPPLNHFGFYVSRDLEQIIAAQQPQFLPSTTSAMAPISWEAPLKSTSKAQRSTSADVTDTFDFFGQKECILKKKPQKSLDECNLGACTTLKTMGSDYETLDTRYLRSLENLDVSGTKLKTLNTEPLGHLWSLDLSFCKITELNTKPLLNLQFLTISFSSIALLDLQPLKKLRCLYTQSAPCKYYDLRCVPQLSSFGTSFGVQYVNLAVCPKLDNLSLGKSSIAHIQLAKDAKLNSFAIKMAKLRYFNARKRYTIKEITQDDQQIVLSNQAPLGGLLAVQPPPAQVQPPQQQTPQVQPQPPQAQPPPQAPPPGQFDQILPPSFL